MWCPKALHTLYQLAVPSVDLQGVVYQCTAGIRCWPASYLYVAYYVLVLYVDATLLVQRSSMLIPTEYTTCTVSLLLDVGVEWHQPFPVETL